MFLSLRSSGLGVSSRLRRASSLDGPVDTRMASHVIATPGHETGLGSVPRRVDRPRLQAVLVHVFSEALPSSTTSIRVSSANDHLLVCSNLFSSSLLNPSRRPQVQDVLPEASTMRRRGLLNVSGAHPRPIVPCPVSCG